MRVRDVSLELGLCVFGVIILELDRTIGAKVPNQEDTKKKA